MPSCEKCWTDAYLAEQSGESHADAYQRLLTERRIASDGSGGRLGCTPEEQAGPDATTCFRCARRTGHQHCGVCMRCGNDPTFCRNCGGKVDRVRWCYATPVCFECLPPPPPIEKGNI